MVETVNSLRKLGFKVRVVHHRTGRMKYIPKEGAMYLSSKDNHCGSNGGKTVVDITKDGEDGHGKAVCSPKDNYDRKRGVQIALNRAYKIWIEKT